MKVVNEQAYGLGKRAYKADPTDCVPFEDKLFMQLVESDETIPLVSAINSYTEGWHEGYNKREAKEKVIPFPGQ
jgi:hypothetical protein